jgi:hypothetical protein
VLLDAAFQVTVMENSLSGEPDGVPEEVGRTVFGEKARVFPLLWELWLPVAPVGVNWQAGLLPTPALGSVGAERPRVGQHRRGSRVGYRVWWRD